MSHHNTYGYSPITLLRRYRDGSSPREDEPSHLVWYIYRRIAVKDYFRRCNCGINRFGWTVAVTIIIFMDDEVYPSVA